MEGNTSLSNKAIEELVLNQIDLLIVQAKSQGEKVIYELFKSAILKKYKDNYDVEILQGKVHKETLNKCVDFIFTDLCAKIRLLPNIDDYTKDAEIERGRQLLDTIKITVAQMLANNGIVLI